MCVCNEEKEREKATGAKKQIGRELERQKEEKRARHIDTEREPEKKSMEGYIDR